MPSPNAVIKKWMKKATPDQVREVAKAADTSVMHLYHVAAGRRGMTAEMAQRLAHANKTLHVRALYLDQQALCKACAECPIAKLARR